MGAQQAELDCSGQAAHQPWKPVGEEQEEVEVDHIFCKKKQLEDAVRATFEWWHVATARSRGPAGGTPPSPPPPEFPWKFSFAIFSIFLNFLNFRQRKQNG